MGSYSWPYLILIFIYILILILESYDVNKKLRLQVRLISAIVFILFFGFRGNIGSDWYNYQNYYSSTTLKEWNLLDFEVGFSLVTKIFSDLGLSYGTYIVFIVITEALLFDNLINRFSKSIALPYIIVISLFPLLIIDLLRNFLSILIAMQAISYMYKGKNIKALIVIIISATFHATGIFFLLLFLIKGKCFNKKVIIVWLVVGMIIYILQIRFFDVFLKLIGSIAGGRIEYLALGVVEESKNYGITFGIIEKLFFAFVVVLNHNYIVKKNLILPVFVNLFYIYICIYLYFSSSEAFINRFSLLFFAGYMIVIGNIYSGVRVTELKKVVAVTLVIICTMKTYLTFNNVLYRYTNNIFQEDNVELRDRDRYNIYLDKE